jgi:plastocyanin
VKKPLLAVLVAALLCTGAFGCGGDNNDKSGDAATTGTDTSTGTAANGGTDTTGGTAKGGSEGGGKSKVSVDLVDLALQPANPKVKTGTVVFRIKNKGTLLHAVRIDLPGGDKSAKAILPGKSGTLRVTFDKPGTYVWYCPIDKHRKLGMKGKITAVGGA